MTLSAYNTVGLLMWFSYGAQTNGGKGQTIRRFGPRHTHVAATRGNGRAKATIAASLPQVGMSCYRNPAGGGTSCYVYDTGKTISYSS